MVEVAQPAPQIRMTKPKIVTRACTFALFGKSWAIAKWVPPSQKNRRCRRSETPAIACRMKRLPFLTNRIDSFAARSAISTDVLLRDGHFAPDSKGVAGDFQSRRCLFALVFIQIDPALHPPDRFLVETACDDIACAEVFFHVKMQELIENLIGGKGVLILLVWF